MNLTLKEARYLATHLEGELEYSTQHGDMEIDWEHFHKLNSLIGKIHCYITEKKKTTFYIEENPICSNLDKPSVCIKSDLPDLEYCVAEIWADSMEEAKHKAQRYIDEVLLTEL